MPEDEVELTAEQKLLRRFSAHVPKPNGRP